MNFDMKKTIIQQFKELFFISSLYGSLSVRFSIMYLIHLFGLNINFGSTQKDDKKITLFDWINSTKYECIIYNFYLICIGIRLYFFSNGLYFETFYFGCFPLFLTIFWYWFGPIIYDILPNNIDKKQSEYYNNETKMFTDNYNNLILNSKLFMV